MDMTRAAKYKVLHSLAYCRLFRCLHALAVENKERRAAEMLSGKRQPSIFVAWSIEDDFSWWICTSLKSVPASESFSQKLSHRQFVCDPADFRLEKHR